MTEWQQYEESRNEDGVQHKIMPLRAIIAIDQLSEKVTRRTITLECGCGVTVPADFLTWLQVGDNLRCEHCYAVENGTWVDPN